MEMFIENKSRIALQCYDNQSLSKEQLSEIIGVNLKTGEMSEDWVNLPDHFDTSKAQFLIQLFDRKLITKKSLLKQIFNLDVEEKEE